LFIEREKRLFHQDKPAIRSLLIPLLKKYWRTRAMIDRWCRRWYELPFSINHYYSPVPDLPKVKARTARWYRELPFADVGIETESQRSFLQTLTPWNAERGSLPDFQQVTVEGFGYGYGEIEADLLYHCIRRFKPKRFIEIGSGVSTRFVQHAMARNQTEGAAGEIVCIEPNPSSKLQAMAQARQIALMPAELQDVDPGVFDTLGENDILLIDSTHAGKIDSDVYCLYLEIVPRLRPGVVIHIHDITFPYLTPPPSHPLFDSFLVWNEAALVKAFLSFNRHFEILVCQSWLHFKAPDVLREFNPGYDPARHFPASLWLRRAEAK
jgi:predicted O-methyltransferase YrrM